MTWGENKGLNVLKNQMGEEGKQGVCACVGVCVVLGRGPEEHYDFCYLLSV